MASSFLEAIFNLCYVVIYDEGNNVNQTLNITTILFGNNRTV